MPHANRHVLLPHRALLALVLVQGASGGGRQQLFLNSDNIVEFQPEELEDRILKSPTKRAWVVDFYAHWCGHCKHFAPIWEKTAEFFLEDDRIRFGAIDCAKYSSFCSKLGVHGFPTLKAYNFPSMPGSEELKGADMPKQPKAEKLRAFLEPHVSKLPAITGVATESPEDLAKAALIKAAKAKAKAMMPVKASPPSPSPAATERPVDEASLRLVDAEVAIVYSLRQGAFIAARDAPLPSSPTMATAAAAGSLRGSGTAAAAAVGASSRAPTISGEALSQLVAWLDLLAAVLPSQKASQSLSTLAGVARSHQETNGFLDRDAWLKVVESRVIERVNPSAGEDPSPYWRLCQTYTCGLWTLFHLILVAVAEASTKAAFLQPTTRRSLPQPGEALTRIRGFVAHFFGCADCVTHFLDTFDSCKFGRCDLLPSDGRGAALWLWRVHNRVTRRISLEHMPDAPPASAWPSHADCESCWPASSASSAPVPLEPGEERWDSAVVYEHLRHSFWQAEWVAGGEASPATTDLVLRASAVALMITGLMYLLYLCLRKGGRKRGRAQFKKGC